MEKYGITETLRVDSDQDVMGNQEFIWNGPVLLITTVPQCKL